MRTDMEKHGPDFIGIGVQRSASSWLYTQLRQHPGVWLPPVKELHYFDRNPAYPSPSRLSVDSLQRAIRGDAAQERAWRREFRLNMQNCLERQKGKSWRDLPWIWRYFMQFPKDEYWYRSLFKGGEGRCRGEISPAYSLLEESDVALVAELFPAVRILLFLRNPIDRSLSQYFLDKRNRSKRGLAEGMLASLNNEGVVRRSSYLPMLERWSRHFGPDRLFIGWYDDVLADPVGTLGAVTTFLGLPPLRPTAGTDLAERVNRAERHPVPEEIMQALAKFYHPQLSSLAERMGGHAVRWLADCENILARARDNRGG